MRRKWSRVSGVLAALAVGGMTGGAAAQSFPSRPITLIYPFVAGAPAEIGLRLMATDAAKTLGQPVLVEARPGAASKLGIQAQQRAPGDAHLLSMVSSGTVVSVPLTDATFRIEAGKDYTPVISGFLGPFVLAVPSTLPVRDMKGLIAYAKANPGKTNAGVTGIGSLQHLFAGLVAETGGLDGMTVIAYKGESAVVPALIANEVQFAFVSTQVKSQVDAGKLVVLATASTRRLSQLPNVPTMVEAGFPALNNLAFWVGVVAPPGVSRDAVVKLNAAFAISLKNPDTLKRFDEWGYIAMGGTPEEFTAFIHSELNRFRPVVQKLNIKLE